jgi:NTE family protein
MHGVGVSRSTVRQRPIAWGTNELLTNQYFLGQIGYIRELAKLPPLLGSTVDFIGILELGKAYKLPNGPSPPNLPWMLWVVFW